MRLRWPQRISERCIVRRYSDGTDAYLAAVRFAAGTPTTAVAATELTVINLVKLAGTTSISAGDFTAGDFYRRA